MSCKFFVCLGSVCLWHRWRGVLWNLIGFFVFRAGGIIVLRMGLWEKGFSGMGVHLADLLFGLSVV